MRAVRVEGVPEIDGDVLGDPMWDAADPTTGFRQSTPNEGQPASERTEVRIVYNGETLYVGVICYVRDPGTIIVSDSRRDTPLNETDSFRIIIDTYRDSQNGFVFGTNPAGLEYDGQVNRRGARQWPRRRRWSPRPAAWFRWRVEPQLGRRLAGERIDIRDRLVG